jgi:hypothetical protein
VARAPYAGSARIVRGVHGTATEDPVFRGGVNLDLGKRMYGMRRLRATYPFGWLRVTDKYAELGVLSFGTLRGYPLPIRLHREATTVGRRARVLEVGIGFKTESTTHYFLTMHRERILDRCRALGYQVE